MEFRTPSRQWAQLRSNIHLVYLWEGLFTLLSVIPTANSLKMV